ncbi:phage tail protein [Aeromonas salmonicida]|uniref:phage tail tip fiber protein n=1 Tax=Aeromonas salmonicida TaxID=645 RepID=UPI0038BACD9E
MATVTVAGVIAAVSAAASVVSLAMVLTMDRGGPAGQGDPGSNVSRKGKNDPKLVPFGKCLVPATKVWSNVSNNNTKWLTQAYSFGVGPIKSYDQLYIDSVPFFGVSGAPADKWINGETGTNVARTGRRPIGTVPIDPATAVSGEFPNAFVGLRTGKTTEAVYDQLIPHSDGEWSTECRGDRSATISLLVERWINKGGDNNIRIMSDRMRIEALVHGNGVIDPRFDAGLDGLTDVNKRTWINSGKESYRNPAIVLFTYLVDEYYGMAIPVSAIDIASFILLANYCDQVGFKFDGYIDQSKTFGKILIDMMSSFDGMIYVEDGAIKVKADKLSPSVAHITEEDCVGSFRLSNASESGYYNTVNVEFVNSTTVYTTDKYVLPKSVVGNPTITADGFQKSKDIKFPFTVDGGEFKIAKRLANKALASAKYQQTIDFELDNTRKELRVMDVFEISNDAYKLDKKKFRVNKVQTSLDDKSTISKVTATEYNETIYDDTKYDDGITTSPIIPPSLKVASPVGLSFLQNSFTLTGSGLLSWTSRYQKEHRTVVEYKISSAEDWHRLGEVKFDDFNVYNLKADNYDFRVMTVSFMGNTSDWSVLENIKIKGGVTLPKITGGVSTFTGKDCIITWNDAKSTLLTSVPNTPVYDGIKTVGDVFSHYELIVYKGTGRVYKETLSSSASQFTYSYDQNVKTGLDRDLRFEVKIVAKDGSESVGVNIDAHNDQCPQPSGLEVNGELSQLIVTWDSPDDIYKDYAATDIHLSQIQNFVPSASTLKATSSTAFVSMVEDLKGLWFIRIGHYDAFGKIGMVFTPAKGFEMKSIDDLLTNSPTFNELDDNMTGVRTELDQAKKDIDQAESDLNKARADIDSSSATIKAHATDIATLKTTTGSQGALITQNAEAIKSTDGNLAVLSISVDTSFKDANAKIAASQTAITNDVKALADYKLLVTSEFGKTNSNVTNLATTVATGDKALADYKVSVTSEFGKTNSNVTNLSTTVAAGDKALADYKLLVTSEFDASKSSVSNLATTVAAGDKALADYKTVVTAEFGKTNANVTNLTTTVAAGDKALVDYKTVVTAEFGKTNANVTTQSQALATVDGKVVAMHQIKLNVNGKVSGVQLANNGAESTFDVIADRFRISNGTDSQSVFEVADGRTLIRNALIGDLTATNIRAGAITGVAISSNTRIVAGAGNNSVVMDGVDTNWRLYAGNSSGATAPFRVRADGYMFASNADITGKITATSGSFTGAINAQSGQISGYLGVGNSYISGNANQNFIQGADGRFVVDRAGNMSCQYATINGGLFKGQVEVEHLVGDIYRKGFYPIPDIPARIVGGGSGELEFFRANIGSQAFDQLVVLSVVPCPIWMYDNPGKCDIYYQVDGQPAIWYTKIDGPSGSHLDSFQNFSVRVPSGKTWIRFFGLPSNKITYQQRNYTGGGIIEMMKYEQVGWSVHIPS